MPPVEPVAVPSGPPAGRTTGRDPVPVTILGGYLGAGKTTVLNHLLRHAAGRRIAVLVNDFGTVNIDADLIEARDERAISLAGGCVCCGFGDDLPVTLRTLRDAQPPFDHIVIETSGVALPANLRATLSLLEGLRVVATLVLADAETVRRQAGDPYVGDTVRQQLRAADLLLLTKGDLLPEPRVDEVEAWLRAQTPAPVLRAVMGAVPPDIVLGIPEATGMQSSATGLLGASNDGRLRPPAHAAARFETATFGIDAPVDPQRLARALAALTPALARAKGLVRDADGRLHVVQVVGRRGSAEPAAPNAAAAGRLVAISAGEPLDRDAVRAAIDASLLHAASSPRPGPSPAPRP